MNIEKFRIAMDNILSDFNWQNVEDLYKFLAWKWVDTETGEYYDVRISHLKAKAQSLVIAAYKAYVKHNAPTSVTMSGGGLEVTMTRNSLTLRFVPVSLEEVTK